MYVSLLKSKCSEHGMKYTSSRTLRAKNKSVTRKKDIVKDDDVIILKEVHNPGKETKIEHIMRVKLLQFSENNRPAYYGTWRKRSKLVTPKNPYKKDEVSCFVMN